MPEEVASPREVISAGGSANAAATGVNCLDGFPISSESVRVWGHNRNGDGALAMVMEHAVTGQGRVAAVLVCFLRSPSGRAAARGFTLPILLILQ